jgi:hypothetical protein
MQRRCSRKNKLGPIYLTGVRIPIRLSSLQKLYGRRKNMNNEMEEKKLSRRSFVAALFAAAAVIPAATLGSSDAEALESHERQFTGVRHQPRVSRPRSHTRGSRRHRRVARVRHTGSPQPRPDVQQ